MSLQFCDICNSHYCVGFHFPSKLSDFASRELQWHREHQISQEAKKLAEAKAKATQELASHVPYFIAIDNAVTLTRHEWDIQPITMSTGGSAFIANITKQPNKKLLLLRKQK